jgi:hypothetical protein
MKKQKLKEIVEERIDFYAQISNMPEVFFEKFEVVSHPEEPTTCFIHLKYAIHEDKEIQMLDEIDMYVPMHNAWFCLSREMDDKQKAAFLADVKPTKYDVSKIKLK